MSSNISLPTCNEASGVQRDMQPPVPGDGQFNELGQLIQLERRYQTGKNVLSTLIDPSVACSHQNGENFDVRNHVNNQTTIKIANCFMEDDPDAGYRNFRSIRPSTRAELGCLSIDVDKFMALHAENQGLLNQEADTIARRCETRLNGVIGRVDAQQFSADARRSLRSLRDSGVEVLFSGFPADAHGDQLAGTDTPLVENFKNKRLLSVCGFAGTKVGTAVHDVVDHLWTFDRLDRIGLLDKFGDMFDAVGDPAGTDIFKREGEIVAAVSFGLRLLPTVPELYVPGVRLADIKKIFEDHQKTGGLEARHQKAYQILQEVKPDSLEQTALEFGVSSYLAELDEQRRKYGRIKLKGTGSGGVAEELDPLGADYLSFFIEATHALLETSTDYKDTILRVHATLEERLGLLSAGRIPQDEAIVLKLGDLKRFDVQKTGISKGRLDWMTRNFGFSAIRTCMADASS